MKQFRIYWDGVSPSMDCDTLTGAAVLSGIAAADALDVLLVGESWADADGDVWVREE